MPSRAVNIAVKDAITLEYTGTMGINKEGRATLWTNRRSARSDPSEPVELPSYRGTRMEDEVLLTITTRLGPR